MKFSSEILSTHTAIHVCVHGLWLLCDYQPSCCEVGEIWDLASGDTSKTYFVTFDLAVFQIILGSFSALVSNMSILICNWKRVGYKGKQSVFQHSVTIHVVNTSGKYHLMSFGHCLLLSQN